MINSAQFSILNKVRYGTKGVNMLRLQNVTYLVKEGNQPKIILDNISLAFQGHKVTVITGHNGSGKSTLAKIIMGILPLTSGKIFLNEKEITHTSITERVQLGLSFAFQQPVKFKGLTVKDLLDTASNHAHTISELCHYLSMVGLCAREYITRPLDDKLSGGELKRIELAMALAQDKSIMIFDEPEAGIDLWSFDELVALFKTLKQKGKTIIIISHQQKILELADYIIVLSSGKIDKEGKAEVILPSLSLSTKCNVLNKGGKYD